MRVIESQKLPRDSGESIFAARHQDVSQGPLGKSGSYAIKVGAHMPQKSLKVPLLCRSARDFCVMRPLILLRTIAPQKDYKSDIYFGGDSCLLSLTGK